jgi:Flp pilus assembly protein TadB
MTWRDISVRPSLSASPKKPQSRLVNEFGELTAEYKLKDLHVKAQRALKMDDEEFEKGMTEEISERHKAGALLMLRTDTRPTLKILLVLVLVLVLLIFVLLLLLLLLLLRWVIENKHSTHVKSPPPHHHPPSVRLCEHSPCR